MPTAVRVDHKQMNRVAAHVENAQSHRYNLAGWVVYRWTP